MTAICALCGKNFTYEDWDVRHSDGLDELHAACCEFDGPCSRGETTL